MTKVEVGESNVHGMGLFASQDIEPGTGIIEYTGEIVNTMEAERREKNNEIAGVTYIFYYDENFSIDGAVGGNESIYTNHSCEPNAVVKRQSGQIFLYSLRKIEKGEEIFFDYSFDKDDEKVVCNCGSKNCRGYINVIE